MKTRHALLLFLSILSSTTVSQAQVPNAAADYKDIPYANADPAQKLDVYLAKSDQPVPAMVYIHGGGWRAGSKNRIPGFLSTAVKEGWLTVVSVEYRFTNVAPHPAQVNDCMRAVQFVRQNASKWNIDPKRIGVTGGSAGGHLSLWVALHDDAAQADSDDPVERQSSRVSCAVSFAGPTDWNLLGKLDHKHPAYRQLLGYEPGTPFTEMDPKSVADVSPITFASADDPPVLLVQGTKDNIVPMQHAQVLHERLEKAKGKSELFLVEGANHGVAGAGKNVTERSVTFIKKSLLGK